MRSALQIARILKPGVPTYASLLSQVSGMRISHLPTMKNFQRGSTAMSSRKFSQSKQSYDSQDVDEKEIVVVTGGAGFLGQHIVKHVMEQKEFPVREVRVFDIQPLRWFHGLEGTIPVMPTRGSILFIFVK